MSKMSVHSVVMVALIVVIATVWVMPASADPKAPAALESLGEAFVQVAEKVSPAVVNISASRKSPHIFGKNKDPHWKNMPKEFEDFFKRFMPDGPKGPGPMQGTGSGFVISPDGLIVTNSHVVKDADEIKVTMADKKSYTAKVIGIDSESDLALIKIDAKNLSPIKFGDSDKLRVGEIVVAVGSPFGLTRTVTQGIVSAKGRTNVGIIEYEDFIQTDAAINPGNSGGPLVNIHGDVIGINTAIASRSGGYQGIGFAIPSNSAQAIMDQLKGQGKVRRGLLGVNIQDLNEALSKSYGRDNTDGALVSQVIKDSVAEKAGIQSGDIITEFNGEPVRNASHLKNMVGKVKPGSKAALALVRNGKAMKIDVTVGERDPKKMAAMREGTDEPETTGQTSSELGIIVEKVPDKAAEALGIKPGEGLMVKDVSDGIGRKMGLRPGDVLLEVDGKPVSDSSQFAEAVKKAKASKDKVIRLKVKRDKRPPLFMAEKIE
ncbi:MAG: DegQ family serine endoprotease [Thermodesulfobacteriota bacterium]